MSEHAKLVWDQLTSVLLAGVVFHLMASNVSTKIVSTIPSLSVLTSVSLLLSPELSSKFLLKTPKKPAYLLNLSKSHLIKYQSENSRRVQLLPKGPFQQEILPKVPQSRVDLPML